MGNNAWLKGRASIFKATFGPAMAAVAMNFNAELLNGRRIAIPIPLNMTIRELKEELKDFQATDETAKMLSAVVPSMTLRP